MSQASGLFLCRVACVRINGLSFELYLDKIISPMTSAEFSPYEYFTRVFRYWWVVLLVTIIGGGAGFAFYQLHPPVYEATTTYFVTLDLTRFPIQGVREDAIQYNEDMALNTTEGALLTTTVLNDVIKQANDRGISLTEQNLRDNYTIERRQDVWYLRYRSAIPVNAQTVANLWAASGYQEMLAWQASGLAPAYVIFQPPTLALLPSLPVAYGRSNTVLAGALIGFVIGIGISGLVSRPTSKPLTEAQPPEGME